MAKIEELESLCDGPPPKGCHFQHVGDLNMVESLLDKAIMHMQPDVKRLPSR